MSFTTSSYTTSGGSSEALTFPDGSRVTIEAHIGQVSLGFTTPLDYQQFCACVRAQRDFLTATRVIVQSSNRSIKTLGGRVARQQLQWIACHELQIMHLHISFGAFMYVWTIQDVEKHHGNKLSYAFPIYDQAGATRLLREAGTAAIIQATAELQAHVERVSAYLAE